MCPSKQIYCTGLNFRWQGKSEEAAFSPDVMGRDDPAASFLPSVQVVWGTSTSDVKGDTCGPGITDPNNEKVSPFLQTADKVKLK